MIHNSNLSSIHSYQKQKSYSENPKIILIDFDYSFDLLIDIQESIGINISKETIMSIILDAVYQTNATSIINACSYKMLMQDMKDEVYVGFFKEVDIIAREYIRLAEKISKILKTFNLFTSNSPRYYFADLHNETTLILHRLTKDDLL